MNKLAVEYQSEYLREGFAQEQIELYNFKADLENKIASANLKIINPYKPQYTPTQIINLHLSDLTAYRALGQLITGYNCTQFNKPKNELGELWQISYSTKNTKSISLDNQIPISAECTKWIVRPELIYQTWEFNILNSFYGEVKCAISNPNPNTN